MNKQNFAKRRTILFGAVALLMGICTLIWGREWAQFVVSTIALYYMGTAVINLFVRFVMRRKEVIALTNIIQLILAGVFFYVNEFTDVPINILVILLGIYQLFMAGVSGITYWMFRKNKVEGGGRFLFDAIWNAAVGIGAIMSPSGFDGEFIFLIIAIYLISLGISNIRDGLFFDNDRDQQELRRRTRVSLPIIIAAFIPAAHLNKFNQALQGEADSEQEENPANLAAKEGLSRDLEVFVHTSQKDIFGAIGHVDICYKGKVISFGSYDPFSERLFGTMGDGVLFKVEKDAYIDFAKKEGAKTLFGYSLHLTDEQRKAIEARLEEIDSLTVPWDPSAELKNDAHTYAYRLKHELGAETYKFSSSRFKTYFVLSTNCVLLADSILGQAGTEILNPKGFIAPGTYQAYLQYELESARPLVVAETVY